MISRQTSALPGTDHLEEFLETTEICNVVSSDRLQPLFEEVSTVNIQAEIEGFRNVGSMQFYAFYDQSQKTFRSLHQLSTGKLKRNYELSKQFWILEFR